MTMAQFIVHGAVDISHYDGSGYMFEAWPDLTRGAETHYWYSYYWSPFQIPGVTDPSGYEHGVDIARSADNSKTIFVLMSRTKISVFNHTTRALITTNFTLMSDIAQPSLSNGKILFMGRYNSGPNRIWIMNENGSGLRALSNVASVGIGPGALSPDGTWAVWSFYSGFYGKRHLVRGGTAVGASSFDLTQVWMSSLFPEYPETDMPVISPDGLQIAFTAGVLSTINRYNPATWVRFGIFRMASDGFSAPTYVAIPPTGPGWKVDCAGWWPWNDGIVYDAYGPGGIYDGLWTIDWLGSYHWYYGFWPHGWSSKPCFSAN